MDKPLFAGHNPVHYADAERLAEALRPFTTLLQAHHANLPDDRLVFGINGAEITAGDLRRAVEAIAAHSAQAQPPAASVPDAEAELAALRKRVDDAPTGTLLVNYSHGQPISANIAADDGEALAAIDQCSVRLVVDDA
jgi:hypothetical protein